MNKQPGMASFGFSRIFVELCGRKVQLAPSHGNFFNVVANPEIVYYCYNSYEEVLETCKTSMSELFTKVVNGF